MTCTRCGHTTKMINGKESTRVDGNRENNLVDRISTRQECRRMQDIYKYCPSDWPTIIPYRCCASVNKEYSWLPRPDYCFNATPMLLKYWHLSL